MHFRGKTGTNNKCYKVTFLSHQNNIINSNKLSYISHEMQTFSAGKIIQLNITCLPVKNEAFLLYR